MNKIQRLVSWVTRGKWELWPSGTVIILDGCTLTVSAGTCIPNFVIKGGSVVFDNNDSPPPPDVSSWYEHCAQKHGECGPGRLNMSIQGTRPAAASG